MQLPVSFAQQDEFFKKCCVSEDKQEKSNSVTMDLYKLLDVEAQHRHQQNHHLLPGINEVVQILCFLISALRSHV